MPQKLVLAVEEELAEVAAPLRKQIGALSDLFQLFTRDRSRLRGFSYLDDPKLRTAYLRYHFPMNFARATRVLEEVLRIHPAIAEIKEVVDLGAGLGSATLATLLTLPGDESRAYSLYDRSSAAVKLARRLMEKCTGRRSRGPVVSGGKFAFVAAGPLAVTTGYVTMPQLPALPRRSLVWLSMVLNELEATLPSGYGARRIISRLEERLGEGAILLIIEPALRGPARALLEVHDAAVASGGWRVLGPCTHQLSCPLLRERDRSWCHFRFRWNAPAFVRQAADPLRLEYAEPSLAYLALERRASQPKPAEKGPTPSLARVIGDVMPLRGAKQGIYICQEGKRKLAAPAPGVMRGDVIATQGEKLSVEASWESTPLGRGGDGGSPTPRRVR